MNKSDFVYRTDPEDTCYKYKCMECGNTILVTHWIIPNVDPDISCKCGSKRVEYMEE